MGSDQYPYIFHAKAQSGYDATATHTVGICGSRNLTVFKLGTNYASTTFNFVPDGAAVSHVIDQIETVSFNNCHNQLSAHGGSRRGLTMCVLCHNPQNLDPNDGNHSMQTSSFRRFTRGASLPRVITMSNGHYRRHTQETMTMQFRKPVVHFGSLIGRYDILQSRAGKIDRKGQRGSRSSLRGSSLN